MGATGGGKGGIGFENAFKLVGGHGRFQWFCLTVCSLQLLMMTWNHLGYIFMGAVPQHWCHITELDNSSWTVDQIKNISIPKVYSKISGEWKYDQCQYYHIDYKHLLEQSQGDFQVAYGLAHPHHPEKSISAGDDYDYSGSDSDESKSPNQKAACQAWSYDKSIYISTIVTEFDLVCSNRYLVASIQALYMIGAFMGTLMFGPLNDKILGRRKSTLVAIVMVIIGGFLTSLSTSYIMFIASRFLVAIGTAGCMQASSVWFLEHCDTKSRAKLYCIGGTFFGFGYAIMPLYAYFIRTWSNLQLSFTLTTLSLLSFYWIFPESPRWLASHGRDEEAVKALVRIAKYNRIVPQPSRAELLKCVQQCHLHNTSNANEQGDDDDHHHEEEDDDVACKQSMMLSSNTNSKENNEITLATPTTAATVTKRKQQSCRVKMGKTTSSCLARVSASVKNFGTLVSTRELRRISFVIWILFITVAFVYYGFAFSSTTITTNPYLVVSLGAFMEVPASVLPIPFLSRWGRRPTTVASYVLTGVAALAIALTPAAYEGVRTVLSMIGKLFVASAFTVLYLVANESYPTVARGTGQGASTLMGRIGSIAAPYVADMLTTVYPDLPSVIFGIVSLVAAFIALLLPEMKDVHMKDQVYEYQQDEEQPQEKGKRQSGNKGKEINATDETL